MKLSFNKKSIKADSFLGEVEEFFTRDDEIEYIEIPLEEKIREEFNIPQTEVVNIRAYIEDGNKLDVDIELSDCMFNIELDKPIDMRKIRKPSDLQKYVAPIFEQFKIDYIDCMDLDIYSCDIVASSKSEGKFIGYCFYTASNPTWGGDAQKRLERLGGTKAELKLPRPNGKGLFYSAEWAYLFTSESQYDDFKQLLKDDGLSGFIRLQPYHELPDDAEYKIDKYAEVYNTINASSEPNPDDWEFNAVPLKSLKKGDWFTIKPIAYPDDKEVYIKDEYDRETKKFCCGRCDDISYSREFPGNKLVYTDFIY